MAPLDTKLQKLLRNFAPNEVLFRQGEMGNSMFLVVEGLVRIFLDSPQGEYLITVLGPGEIVGEKALLQREPYRRSFCAGAKTPTTVMEIDFETQKIVNQTWPDFQIRMFKMVLQRLDKSNKLVYILQQREPIERFCAFIQYYIHEICKNYPENTPITITSNEIRYGANLEKDFVEECIHSLQEGKIFTPTQQNSFIIHTQNFENYLPYLRERVAA